MSGVPTEKEVKDILAAARNVMSSSVDADVRDLAAPESEHLAKLWRSVLRRLPRDLEYLAPDDVVDENLKCPVCLCWLKNPVRMGCPAGHLICRKCSSGLHSCPLDRQLFTSTTPAEAPIQARLGGLQVRCPNATAGCGWTGSRASLVEHCKYHCEHGLDECRECGAHVRRCERNGHIHSFEVGARVVHLPRQGDSTSFGAGEVLKSDVVGDLVTVRFADGVQICHRSLLARETASEQRQAQIDSMLNVYELAEKLNTCFLVDCTGSMSPHITSVRSQIFRIVGEMHRRLPSMQLHIAFVGYRDIGDTTRFEVLPFTTSVQDFQQFVGRVGAFGCGGDIPEDVLGGLDEVLKLDWDVGGAATRALIHIGDAPCHGEYYQDRSTFRYKDNYPQGDPFGLQAPMLLQSLRARDVQYIFGRINQSTDKMISLFDEEAGGSYIQTRDMRDTSLITEVVTTSLHTSVATTVSTLTAGRAPNRVETCDEVPYWNFLTPEQVQLHVCSRVSSISDLRKEAPSSLTRCFQSREASLKLAPQPFSQGETRAAKYAQLDGCQFSIAKHMKRACDSVDDEDEDDEEEEVPSSLQEFICLSEVSSVAAFLADQFSLEGGSKISFLESHVVVPSNGGKPFNLEDALPVSEFRRFSNNIGWWEPDAPEVLMRFMRWTHEVTDGHMMVVDLQGVRTDDGFVLTDPCILCTDVTRFGSGNLGPRAMSRCLVSLTAYLDRPMVVEEPEPMPAPSWASAPSRMLPVYNSAAPHVPSKLSWGSGPSEVVETVKPAEPGLLQKVASNALATALHSAGIHPNSTATGMKRETKTLDVDSIIARLLVPPEEGRKVKLPADGEVKLLCSAAREKILAQPPLLELEAPIKILGDIHGQFPDLLRFFQMTDVEKSNYLFLGDYVDRGKQSLETIILLLALKLKRPENFFLLRGNHECASITRIYGFYDECKRRFNIKLWKSFCDVFNCFPLAAVVEDKIFCCHGGPSPELTHLDKIRRIMRPTDVPDTGIICDLLWADPDQDMLGWCENDRGVSFTFGPDVAQDFLCQHDLDLIARAHQVVEDGYEFFANRRLVTIFSAPNYCGEFDNAGAVLEVKDDMLCTFKRVRGCPQRK
mmetsp:Transcript_159834/g.298018  ORF Transcript_159834/g.298018 Transcript_159834/m.298018 type:complete len:1108 (-) Transcript_159834:131-3454(-)